MSECLPQLFADVGRKGCQYGHEQLHYCAFVAFERSKLVGAYHEGADGGVVREVGDVLGYLLYQSVDGLQLFACGLFVGEYEVVLLVEADVPYFSEETVTTIDAVGVPGFGLFQRAEEHFVQTQCVGTEVLDDGVGVYDVVHRLTHLFYCPSADVLAVLQNEFCVVVLGTPCAEGFDVKLVVLDDVYIHVQGCHVVLF